MFMRSTRRKFLQYNEAKLRLSICFLQELIERIENQDVRCRILNCLLTAKFSIVLQAMDIMLYTRNVTSHEKESLLNRLLQFDPSFMSKLRSSEQDAIKQHVKEIKNLVRQNHEKIRDIYSEEGAKNACIAEYDEMVKLLTKEMSRSSLARIAEKISGNTQAEICIDATSNAPTATELSSLSSSAACISPKSLQLNAEGCGPTENNSVCDNEEPSRRNSSYTLLEGRYALLVGNQTELHLHQELTNFSDSIIDCAGRKEKLKRVRKAIQFVHEASANARNNCDTSVAAGGPKVLGKNIIAYHGGGELAVKGGDYSGIAQNNKLDSTVSQGITKVFSNSKASKSISNKIDLAEGTVVEPALSDRKLEVTPEKETRRNAINTRKLRDRTQEKVTEVFPPSDKERKRAFLRKASSPRKEIDHQRGTQNSMNNCRRQRSLVGKNSSTISLMDETTLSSQVETTPAGDQSQINDFGRKRPVGVSERLDQEDCNVKRKKEAIWVESKASLKELERYVPLNLAVDGDGTRTSGENPTKRYSFYALQVKNGLGRKEVIDINCKNDNGHSDGLVMPLEDYRNRSEIHIIQRENIDSNGDTLNGVCNGSVAEEIDDGASGLEGNVDESGLEGNVDESGLKGNVDESGLKGNVDESGLKGNVDESGLEGNVDESGLEGNVDESGLEGNVDESGAEGNVDKSGTEEWNTGSAVENVIDTQSTCTITAIHNPDSYVVDSFHRSSLNDMTSALNDVDTAADFLAAASFPNSSSTPKKKHLSTSHDAIESNEVEISQEHSFRSAAQSLLLSIEKAKSSSDNGMLNSEFVVMENTSCACSNSDWDSQSVDGCSEMDISAHLIKEINTKLLRLESLLSEIKNVKFCRHVPKTECSPAKDASYGKLQIVDSSIANIKETCSDNFTGTCSTCEVRLGMQRIDTAANEVHYCSESGHFNSAHVRYDGEDWRRQSEGDTRSYGSNNELIGVMPNNNFRTDILDYKSNETYQMNRAAKDRLSNGVIYRDTLTVSRRGDQNLPSAIDLMQEEGKDRSIANGSSSNTVAERSEEEGKKKFVIDLIDLVDDHSASEYYFEDSGSKNDASEGSSSSIERLQDSLVFNDLSNDSFSESGRCSAGGNFNSARVRYDGEDWRRQSVGDTRSYGSNNELIGVMPNNNFRTDILDYESNETYQMNRAAKDRLSKSVIYRDTLTVSRRGDHNLPIAIDLTREEGKERSIVNGSSSNTVAERSEEEGKKKFVIDLIDLVDDHSASDASEYCFEDSGSNSDTCEGSSSSIERLQDSLVFNNLSNDSIHDTDDRCKV